MAEDMYGNNSNEKKLDENQASQVGQANYDDTVIQENAADSDNRANQDHNVKAELQYSESRSVESKSEENQPQTYRLAPKYGAYRITNTESNSFAAAGTQSQNAQNSQNYQNAQNLQNLQNPYAVQNPQNSQNSQNSQNLQNPFLNNQNPFNSQNLQNPLPPVPPENLQNSTSYSSPQYNGSSNNGFKNNSSAPQFGNPYYNLDDLDNYSESSDKLSEQGDSNQGDLNQLQPALYAQNSGFDSQNSGVNSGANSNQPMGYATGDSSDSDDDLQERLKNEIRNLPEYNEYPPIKANPNRSNSAASHVMVAIISAAVSAIICVVMTLFAINNGLISLPQSGSLSGLGSSAVTGGKGSAIIKGGNAPDWATVAKNVYRSVVSIQMRSANMEGKGSGAIVDTEGHIVTNNHVVSGAEQIQVTLSTGEIYKAQVVGTDKTTDLAVLKIVNPPKNLQPVKFADSNSLAVGEAVMAIGNPLGYSNTATTGIVSSLHRPVSVMDDKSRSEIVTDAVQIDAAINPGNSGGPTFNAAGQVIGINSSIASSSSKGSVPGSIGIGFAIPSNLTKRVVDEIIKNGSVKHVALGITIRNALVTSNNVSRGGAQIVSVTAGTPAAKAGLREGDTIVAFNGEPVSSNYSLLGYVRATALNGKASLTVVRGNNTIKLNVVFNQEEAAVMGETRKDPRSRVQRGDNQGNKDNQDSQNPAPAPAPKQNKHDGDDDDDSQQRGDDDDGGIFDPFGFW